LKGYEQRLDRHGEVGTEKAFASLNIGSKFNRTNSQNNHNKSQNSKWKPWSNKAEGNKASSYEAGNKASSYVKNEITKTGDKCKFCDKLHYGECWVKNKVRCHKCNKIGHIARYCNINKNVQQGNFANQVEKTGNLFYANHTETVKRVSDEWYIDSGCSNHMTSREICLLTLIGE